MEKNELIKEISEKTGKTEEEINKLIQAKVKKFSGLLTEQGATFMIQKELGLKQENGIEAKISELKDGMKDVDIEGIIKNIYPVKEFEKGGKTGRVSSFLMDDKSGLVRVTLWNDQVDKYDLTIGSRIKISNGFVSSYNEKTQLSLGYNGTIEILEKKDEVFEKISELKAGMNNANVVGRLVRRFPCKEFNNGERQGKLCNFQFGDETALLRATAWNEKADEVQNFIEGDVLEIKNAYTKDGLFGVELNLGYSALLKKSDKAMPNLVEILKENISEKNINELVEGENIIINGKIKTIENRKLFFVACEKCGKKVEGNICESCGEVKGEKRFIVNSTIEDDTGEIRASFFGENALKLLGKQKDELEKELEEKSVEKIIEEINEKIGGNKIKILGYEKTNSYSGENEFSVKDVF